uniref:Uncharacterized protein n=1 Tax=Bradyrhizobium ottawaense TaxID=931866 RepID=A0A2U8PJP2_9BRAD|nr:hypothetical protein CIT37_04410 [Bradyrhizobium ottawaense]
MSHVDDLVQPGPEQIVRACRPVLLWSHRSLRCSTESRFAAAGKSKIEIAGFCCEAPIPCNLKCRRNRKTDSQSSAWRLVHGQHPKLIAETREATTSPGARASSPWPRVCRTRCGRSAGQRVSIAPGQGASPYQSPVNGVVVQVSLQHAAEPRAGINDERLAAVRYAVSYRAILALRESIVTRRIVMRVSRDRERGFQGIVSNDFAGS